LLTWYSKMEIKLNPTKFFSYITLAITLLVSCISFSATCPNINTIKRVDGEYKWETSIPGWSGYFVAPTTGKGRSYTAERFLGASWIKSHDTRNATGFIQCDYIGNFGYDSKHTSKDPGASNNYEVIRLVQDNAMSSRQPSAKMAWNCQPITKYPNIACNCYSSLTGCNFSIG